ncbi:hypothetical protein EVAR_95737_1 [Eumeta japonica]|uniref:Uncharacterized protein n=1 Tax=Eumeta variegata TaxID=151549 RepID=A0A4C1UKH4_EUMVA|nr:hypothetical protein EVAR_95737_1 [Eumeta japonica]
MFFLLKSFTGRRRLLDPFPTIEACPVLTYLVQCGPDTNAACLPDVEANTPSCLAKRVVTVQPRTKHPIINSVRGKLSPKPLARSVL